MSEGSRDRIFSRLHARHPAVPGRLFHNRRQMPIKTYSRKEKIEKLKTLMEAMRTEVHITGAENWMDTVEDVLKAREAKSLLYAPGNRNRQSA